MMGIKMHENTLSTHLCIYTFIRQIHRCQGEIVFIQVFMTH